MSLTCSSPRRFGWIGGWGIQPDSLAAAVRVHWPQSEHVVLPPGEHAVRHLLDQRCDLLAGYSFGSLLLFSHEGDLPAGIPVIAVAPIIAFCKEAGRGGSVSRAILRSLQTRLSEDPADALRTYFKLARLSDEVGDALPYSTADLAWGLEALGRLVGRPERVSGSRLFVGERDRLIDFKLFGTQAVGYHLIPSAGHDFRQLLPEVARHV